MRTLVVAGLTCLVGFVIMLGVKKHQEEKELERMSAPRPAAPAPAPPPIEVTAKQLQADYDANEVAADQTYRGRVIRVSGAVRQIDKDFTDRAIVWLRTSDFGGVMSYFEDQSAPASLRKRQQVTLLCVGDGFIMGSPVLKRCVLEPSDRDIEAALAAALAEDPIAIDSTALEQIYSDDPGGARRLTLKHVAVTGVLERVSISTDPEWMAVLQFRSSVVGRAGPACVVHDRRQAKALSRLKPGQLITVAGINVGPTASVGIGLERCTFQRLVEDR